MRRTRLKVKGRSRFPRQRTPGYAQFIRENPCALCGSYPTECAHVKSRGAGGADIDNCLALCHRCHADSHTEGIKSFATRWRVSLEAIAKAYGDVWRARHPTDTLSACPQDAPGAP